MESAVQAPIEYYEYYRGKGYSTLQAYYKVVRRWHDGIFKNYTYPKVIFDKYFASNMS